MEKSISEILYSIIVGALILGGLTVTGGTIYLGYNQIKSIKREFLESTFELNEHSILAKSYEQNVSGNRRGISTCHNYEFIVDVDEDGIYNKNKDAIIRGENVPFFLSEKDNKAVYVEHKTSSGKIEERFLVAIKDKNGNYNLTSNLSDVYNENICKRNESYNKVKQLFKEKIQNQR